MAAATGSPASRRLTKLTPLTTRPSFTSRQGMTRTLNTSRRLRCADQRQSGRRVKPAVVQSAADDRARKPVRAGRKKRVHIVERSKASRGNDRNRHRIGESDRGIEIETAQHAVARDVGVDDGGDAG